MVVRVRFPCLVLAYQVATGKAAMRIYTFYSDSHKELLDEFFLKSVDTTKHDVVIKRVPQLGDGLFESGEWWHRQMTFKLDLIKEGVAKETQPFLYCDCDVQFFRPFEDDLLTLLADSQKDMLAQVDGPSNLCAGFIVMKPLQNLVALWEKIFRRSLATNINDQIMLNRLLRDYRSQVTYDGLPSRYWSVWRATRGVVWNQDMPLYVPKDITMHHGNYAYFQDKAELMRRVRDEVRRDRDSSDEPDLY